MNTTTTPIEALRACFAALKQIDHADCKDELVWKDIVAAQATAEGVLRDGALTDEEMDAVLYPPRAQLKAEDWDPSTKQPRAGALLAKIRIPPDAYAVDEYRSWVPVAAQPVAAVSVQRYSLEEKQCGTGHMVYWDKSMVEDAEGDWVKHSDIAPVAGSAAPSGEVAALQSIQRYDESDMEGGGVAPSRSGPYVKLSDVLTAITATKE